MPSLLYKRTGMLGKKDASLSIKPSLFISSKTSPEIDPRIVGLLEGDGEGNKVGSPDGDVVMLGDSLGDPDGILDVEGERLGSFVGPVLLLGDKLG